MIEELSTVTFSSGWSRMERVLFLLTLLLTICVLLLCSAIMLILFGDIKLPTRISTPPSAVTDFTFTTINKIKQENLTSSSTSFVTREITATSVTPEYKTTAQKVTSVDLKTMTPSPEHLKTCETPGCVIAASRMLQSMNLTLKPCEDFYQYACGSWIKSHPVRSNEVNSIFRESIDEKTQRVAEMLSSSIEPDDIEAVKQTKTAYASCLTEIAINEKSNENVLYLINTAGGMPFVNLNWTMDQSLEDFLIGLRRNFAVIPLLPVTVKMDEKNISRNLIHIGSEQDFTDNVYSAKLYDPLYDQLATLILKQFNISRKAVRKQIDELRTFQERFAAIKWQTKVNVDNVQEIYNPTALSELQANYTTFDWKHYLEGLLSVNGNNITLSQDETVIIASPLYITRLMALMNETRNRTIVNYSIFSAIMFYKDSLGIEGRSLYTVKKDKKVSRLRYDMQIYRTISCVEVFISNCKHVLGWMYLRKYFNDQTKALEKIKEMTDFMKNAVQTLIETTSWLEPKSKQYGISKIKNLLGIIGYNNETMTVQNVNELFKGLTMHQWNYFRNLIQIISRQMDKIFSQFRTSTSRISSDGDGMFEVNAWYESQRNMITIPAGTIRNPFFDIDSPMAINFGSLGTIVGHELMHAYDDEGSLFNSKGDFFPWLSPADRNNFFNLSQSLVKQYSSFKIPNTDVYVNGKKTLGENIADNAGLKITYQSYLSWEEKSRQRDYRLPGLNLNPRQLFFLAFAQTWCSNYSPLIYENHLIDDDHAPDVARVLLTLRNSKMFSSVYGCPLGSKMNPAKKYGLW